MFMLCSGGVAVLLRKTVKDDAGECLSSIEGHTVGIIQNLTTQSHQNLSIYLLTLELFKL